MTRKKEEGTSARAQMGSRQEGERESTDTRTLMASSASMLQWSLTGGKLRCLAMSAFLISTTSSNVFPFTLRKSRWSATEWQPRRHRAEQERVWLGAGGETRMRAISLPLCCQAAARDGRAAPEGFEARVHDVSFVVNLRKGDVRSE